MSGLEAVLAAHRIVRDPFSLLCACGNWRDKRDYDGTQHQAHVAEQIRAHLAGVVRDEGVREAVAEALSVADGEMTAYSPTACDDHNRWSWRGDGHSEVMRERYRAGVDAAVAAFLAAIA